MRSLPCLSLSLAAITIWTPPAVAAPRLEPGARVRVTYDVRVEDQSAPGLPAPFRKTTGTLAAVTADSLYLSRPALALARSAIGRIEMPVRKGNRAKVAVLTGVVAAVVAVGITAHECIAGSNEGAGCGTKLIVYGATGFFAGAIMGVFLVRDTWEAVPLETIGARD